MQGDHVGVLLRRWRDRRRRSQLDLSLAVGVSTRHLSFVETGRARPSAELLLELAAELQVPLRATNDLLLRAGYAPRFAETPLEHPRIGRAIAAVQRVLDAHDPYPGVLLDRRWNVVGANRGATALVADLPAHVVQPELNLFRVSLHPDGLAPRTHDFPRWATYLLGELDRVVAHTGDPAAAALAEEVRAYPTVADLARPMVPDEPEVVLTATLETPGGQTLSFFTTLTSFGTPRDVTLDELMVELFFPADDATAAALQGAAGTDDVSA